MVNVGNCACRNTFSCFSIPELGFIGHSAECVFWNGLSQHSPRYNVQLADPQATQSGAFSQKGFLGWDFHCVFPDKCSNYDIKSFMNLKVDFDMDHPPAIMVYHSATAENRSGNEDIIEHCINTTVHDYQASIDCINKDLADREDIVLSKDQAPSISQPLEDDNGEDLLSLMSYLPINRGSHV